MHKVHKEMARAVGSAGGAVADPPALPTVLGPFPRAPGCRYVSLALPDDFSTLADVLRFDNTYSLMHTKKVSYTVDVLLPDKASEEKIQGLEAGRPPPAQ